MIEICFEDEILFVVPVSQTDQVGEGLRATHGGEAAATLPQGWTRERHAPTPFRMKPERPSRPWAEAAPGERVGPYFWT
jgi:hypothetical protein